MLEEQKGDQHVYSTEHGWGETNGLQNEVQANVYGHGEVWI